MMRITAWIIALSLAISLSLAFCGCKSGGGSGGGDGEGMTLSDIKKDAPKPPPADKRKGLNEGTAAEPGTE